MAGVIQIGRPDAGVVQLTLAEPEGPNGLTDALCDQLEAALDAAGADPAAKVVLLAGGPEVFCSGATLGTLERVASGARRVRDLQLPRRVLGCPLPVVAALEGHAVGGGLALALCADVRVAAAEARYGFNFTALGFTPGMGTTALLPALTGPGLAAEMLMTSRLYRGRDLQGLGLFDRIVPRAEVASAALDVAQRMAEKPRHVLALLKAALAEPRAAALEAALAREHLMHQVCFAEPGALETIRRELASNPE